MKMQMDIKVIEVIVHTKSTGLNAAGSRISQLEDCGKSAETFIIELSKANKILQAEVMSFKSLLRWLEFQSKRKRDSWISLWKL